MFEIDNEEQMDLAGKVAWEVDFLGIGLNGSID
jgi:hypothetical protein